MLDPIKKNKNLLPIDGALYYDQDFLESNNIEIKISDSKDKILD